MQQVLELAATAIYVMMGVVAVGGLWFVILLWIRTGQKRFPRARAASFLEEIREQMQRGDFDSAAELCDSPPYWSKATPQLILVALEHRSRGIRKLRVLLAERFERDILSDLEYRTSWINTAVKSAPMLGLLGTVVGMINAFAAIAAASKTGIKPEALAQDISFALTTTALGLTIAIPLVMAGNLIHIRIGKLQDSVQEDLGTFLEDLEQTGKSSSGAVA